MRGSALPRPILLLTGMLAGVVASAAPATPPIEEIVVTARQREQPLLEAPLTVDVVSGAELEARQIESLARLDELVPGLVIQNSPGNGATITLRGIGSASGAPSFDQSVSLFVDGIYAPRQREFVGSLFDLERVEVVKGPQTTLLGKNTSLGAIRLLTREPGEKLAGEIRAGWEVLQSGWNASGAIDLPVHPRLGLRLAGRAREVGGFLDNRATGNDIPELRDLGLRATAVARPHDALRVVGSFQHDDFESRGDDFQYGSDELGNAAALAALAGETRFEARFDRNTAVRSGVFGEADDQQDGQRARLELELELGEHRLTSLTGWSHYDREAAIDQDYLPGDYLWALPDERFEQWSQELRLASPAGGRIDYLLGAYALGSDLELDTPQFAAYPFGITGARRDRFDQETDLWSLFAQLGLRVHERVRLSGGLRYTDERKRVRMARDVLVPGLFSTVIFPGFASTRLARNEDPLDAQLLLELEASENAHLWASWAKGSKSGGFADSVTRPELAEYADEDARSYELGAKLRLLDGRATLQLAGFSTEVNDFQVVVFTGTAFQVNNLDVRTRGLDLDARLRASETLTLFLAATFADAENLDGHDDLPRAPRLSGSAGWRWQRELGRLRAALDGTLHFRSRMSHQLDPASPVAKSQGYVKLDLRAALASPDHTAELALIARNLFDEQTSSFGFPAAFVTGATVLAQEAPRTLLLQASLRF